MAVNYGLDRVRFIAPVRAGKRVRGHFTLAAIDDKAPGQIAASPRRHGRDRRRAQARPHRPLARPHFHLGEFPCPHATPSSSPPPARRSAAPTRARSTPRRAPTLGALCPRPRDRTRRDRRGRDRRCGVGRGADPGHPVGQHRPPGRASRRLPGRGQRPDHRPPVRLGPDGHRHRRQAGDHRPHGYRRRRRPGQRLDGPDARDARRRAIRR